MGNTLTTSLIIFLLLLSSFPVHAGTIQLPQTGQTTCWNAAGESISCAETRQDGETRIGATLPGQRFVDNNNGTLTDTLTGLVWLKNADCAGSLTWQNALAWSNALSSENPENCGLSDLSNPGDWRLPNVTELESLINRQEPDSSTWLTSMTFTNVRPNGYWTSSTNASISSYAWLVDMEYGLLYDVAKANPTNVYFVWPVRAGQ